MSAEQDAHDAAGAEGTSEEQPAKIDPELRRRIDAANEEQRLIYELRGQILSDVNEMEAQLNYTIAAHFGFTWAKDVYQKRDQMVTWLLSRISLSEKLVAVRQMAEAQGAIEFMKPILNRLAWAVEVRNEAAHSYIGFDLPYEGRPGDDEPNVLEALTKRRSVRQSRTGLSALIVTANHLTKQRDAVRELSPHLGIYSMAVMAVSDERSVLTILEETYDLNPEMKEERSAYAADPRRL